MGAPAEAQIDSLMNQAFAFHPLADSHFSQQVDSALLQQAGAHSLLTVFAAVRFKHDGFNSTKMQQLGKHQTGRPGANNPYLSAHFAFARGLLPSPDLGAGELAGGIHFRKNLLGQMKC